MHTYLDRYDHLSFAHQSNKKEVMLMDEKEGIGRCKLRIK